MDGLDIDKLFSEALSDVAISQIIRPSAILHEREARAVLARLEVEDVCSGGNWRATPTVWERYDQPWSDPQSIARTRLLGSIHVVYDSPRRYRITIYRALVTVHGHDAGWDVTRLCDEALGFAGLTLADCPRADLPASPPVFRVV